MADYLQLGVNSVKELFTWLTERSKSKDIIKNDLLRELRDNMKLLDHRDKKEVNLPVLIQQLSSKAIEAAYQKNYNFNKLTEDQNKLRPDLILNKKQEKYIGWDASKFIYSIEGKIRDIKNLPLLYVDFNNAPINLAVRLDNLFYQVLLLILFIRKS